MFRRGPGGTGRSDRSQNPAQGPGETLSGPFHSALAAHFHAAGSNYRRRRIVRWKAFLPGHLLTWISHVARFWFRRKHNFRDFTTDGKAMASTIFLTTTDCRPGRRLGHGNRRGADGGGSRGQGASGFHDSLWGDVYYVGDGNRSEGKFPGREKRAATRPSSGRWASKGSFALTGNHEMYAHGNGYFRYVLPKMG